MKIINPDEIKAIRQGARAGLLLFLVALLALEGTSITQYLFSKKGMQEEATLRARSQLETIEMQIMDVVNQAEAAVRNSVWIAQWCLESPDSLVRVTQRILADNPVVKGSTVALVPGYLKEHPLFAPYTTVLADGSMESLSLATEEYDYPSQEWFTKPLELDGGYWSEPYFDEGGGEMLMTTFSVPVKDREGKVAAVLTADISLEWLTDLMEHTKPYHNSYNIVVSRSGKLMLSTDSGNQDVENTRALVYSTTVDRTGWELSIIIPRKDIYAGVRKVGAVVKLLQILGIVLIILILRIMKRNQMEYKNLTAQKEVMESELCIGHNIQMAMVPKTFPAFPKRTDLDIAACIVPAKEVGGDLYDFYIRDEKLFFCIGDVSGKGVPASLVMTVTQSLFRAISSRENSPSKIVGSMNDLMAEKNESSMFVTFFCGVLDLETGHLRYCNAGHNPALMLDGSESDNGTKVKVLPVVSNIPLGLDPGYPFQEQETDLSYEDTIFLYTDGVTEAENATFNLFGEERLSAVLGTKCDAHGYLEATRAAVNEFVGDTPQNDDITVLVVRYLTTPIKKERHLILHNDIQQIPQLADFMETIAEEKHLSQNDTMSLNLALEEAVTNVILYAYPDGSDGLVDIEAVLREHLLEFIITDSGIPFDPTSAPEVDINLLAEERSIGGLGIHLVRQIMDEVRYQRIDNKNVLTLIKKI